MLASSAVSFFRRLDRHTHTTPTVASLSQPQIFSINRSVEISRRGLAIRSSIIWNSLLASRTQPAGEESSKVERSRVTLPMVSRLSTSVWERVMARRAASSSPASKGLVR